MFTYLQMRTRCALLGKMNSLYPTNLPLLDTPLLVKCSPISYAFMMALLRLINTYHAVPLRV
jgi:hypothetical protein